MQIGEPVRNNSFSQQNNYKPTGSMQKSILKKIISWAIIPVALGALGQQFLSSDNNKSHAANSYRNPYQVSNNSQYNPLANNINYSPEVNPNSSSSANKGLSAMFKTKFTQLSHEVGKLCPECKTKMNSIIDLVDQHPEAVKLFDQQFSQLNQEQVDNLVQKIKTNYPKIFEQLAA